MEPIKQRRPALITSPAGSHIWSADLSLDLGQGDETHVCDAELSSSPVLVSRSFHHGVGLSVRLSKVELCEPLLLLLLLLSISSFFWLDWCRRRCGCCGRICL